MEKELESLVSAVERVGNPDGSQSDIDLILANEKEIPKLSAEGRKASIWRLIHCATGTLGMVASVESAVRWWVDREAILGGNSTDLLRRGMSDAVWFGVFGLVVAGNCLTGILFEGRRARRFTHAAGKMEGIVATKKS